MKTIGIISLNNNHYALFEKIHSTEKIQLILQAQLNHELTKYDGIIYLLSSLETNSLDHLKTFMLQSKPILCFYPLSEKLALIQEKQLAIPVSIASSENKIMKNLEYIQCPINDFITDRYAKLITSPADWETFSKSENFEKTFVSMCKELVEMA